MNTTDIKKLMEAYQSVVSEKTLTPAEKKKREEIAKAMEKDNPDMPMDKKMAIATATAKRVAEAAGKDIAAKMMKSKTMKAFAPKVAKMKDVSADDLEKMLPDYVPGAEIRKLFEEVEESVDLNEALRKEIETYANKHGGIDKKDMLKVAMMLKKGDRKGAVKYARGLDTDPRDWLLDKMDESMKESVMEGYTDDEIRELCHSEDHDCATILIHPEWGMGKPIKESHAIPDEEGFVEWYDVQFKHGIEEKVYAKDVEIVASEAHKKKMKEEEDEDDDKKKMDPVNKKALKKDFDDRDDKDIDNDGDVDDSDEYLHKRRKAVGKAMAKDKKGGTAEISKIGEAFEDLWSALEEAANPKKGATPPEEMDSKESPKAKEFAAKHKVDVTDEEPTHKTATDAGRATKPAAARPGDNKTGDKNVVNPVKGAVKEDTRTYREKIMDILSGKTWGEIADNVDELKGEE